jgi:ABC-2 type transport system permease protein
MMSTLAAPAAIQLPDQTLASDLRAIKIVWHRDVLRFFADRPRMIGALVQPVLYLFALGAGLGRVMPGMDLQLFMFPGVITMSMMFTCFFSAGSMVWDRELGFMREMMVAPVRRGAIIVGKCLGGATAGMLQACVLLVLGIVIGVPYTPTLVLTLLAELALIAVAMTALALVLAARLRSAQAFMALVQVILMPLFFLSGALYPVHGLGGVLGVLTRLDPLTYAVDPLRRLLLGNAAPVTWNGTAVSVLVELGLVVAIGAVALWVATKRFRDAE